MVLLKDELIIMVEAVTIIILEVLVLIIMDLDLAPDLDLALGFMEDMAIIIQTLLTGNDLNDHGKRTTILHILMDMCITTNVAQISSLQIIKHHGRTIIMVMVIMATAIMVMVTIPGVIGIITFTLIVKGGILKCGKKLEDLNVRNGV